MKLHYLLIILLLVACKDKCKNIKILDFPKDIKIMMYMTEFHSSCSRCVGRCFYCGGKTIKHGFTKENKQR